MHKNKFQEQIQVAIATWSLEACHSVCQRATNGGKTIDELNVWIKELFYIIDDRDFQWAYTNLRGQSDEREYIISVRNFFHSLKEMGFKYGIDFTMEPNHSLVINDKLQNTLRKITDTASQFGTINSYSKENIMFDRVLDFLLPLASTNTISSIESTEIENFVTTSSQKDKVSEKFKKDSKQVNNVSDVLEKEIISTNSKSPISNNQILLNKDELLKLEEEADLHYATGNFYAGLGDFQEALKSYEQAISNYDKNPMYFNNRASTLKRLGRMQEALVQYQELIEKHPRYGKAYLSMASTYIELHNDTAAVNSYKKFLLAFNSGQFNFNPVVGGVNQTAMGVNELETILYTSVNYLIPNQKARAIKAFNEAMSQL